VAKMSRNWLVIGFTCVGRRVQLVRHFRLACAERGLEAYIVGMDAEPELAPAAFFSDEFVRLPRGDDPSYGRRLLEVVKAKGVQLLIPLADWDLPALAELRSELQAMGCLAACCGPETVRIGRDKLVTAEFLRRVGVETPRTALLKDVVAARDWRLPIFAKPRYGGAGKNAGRVDSWETAEGLCKTEIEYIAQELLVGPEITVDVFVDGAGKCRCAVPRVRLEIRGGEVTKSRVRLHEQAMSQARRIAESLPDAFGVLNVQGFILPDGRPAWTELNPRFGGGSPLAMEAGADLAGWLVAMAAGREPDYSACRLTDGLTMLRFDEAIYVAPDQTKRVGKDFGQMPDF